MSFTIQTVVQCTYTPEQAVVLAKNIPELFLVLTNISKGTYECDNCGEWSFGCSGHVSGSGMGYSCTAARVERTVAYHYNKVVVQDSHLPTVEIPFDDVRKQTAALLQNWQEFTSAIAAKAAQYVPCPQVMQFEFDLAEMRKEDRATLLALGEKYKAVK